MKHISETLKSPELRAMLVAEAAAKWEAERLEKIRRFGWRDDCRCDFCGDTGIDPENGRICNCDVGRRKATAHRLEQEWPSLVPWRFQSFRLDTHPNKAAAKRVQDWVKSGFANHENLMLMGPVGSGKTGMAIGAMHSIHMADVRCKFDTFSGFLDQLRPRDTPALDAIEMDDLTGCGLLVIDDLGTQKMTEWVAERLYVIINDRYQNGRPFIITTNKDADELDELLGERIMSRISSSTTMIPVPGADLRQRGAA